MKGGLTMETQEFSSYLAGLLYFSPVYCYPQFLAV